MVACDSPQIQLYDDVSTWRPQILIELFSIRRSLRSLTCQVIGKNCTKYAVLGSVQLYESV